MSRNTDTGTLHVMYVFILTLIVSFIVTLLPQDDMPSHAAARPYLGVHYIPVTQQMNLPLDHGVLLVPRKDTSQPAVVAGSPASKAGLQNFDIICTADGVRLTEGDMLTELIRSRKPGDILALTVWRNGTMHDMQVQLGAL
ncbi:hypothetical protein COW95_03615 [Candidatus Peregrinibacteria bacterium CG22_combo_CG10-13_8_21_14_all_49_11]|nr:MAG: hypothetical protein COW95_03615 [Candidatus Peregrinibacteria bacterium CG22_combo_CG10-13_8_21_14_all_49_11]